MLSVKTYSNSNPVGNSCSFFQVQLSKCRDALKRIRDGDMTALPHYQKLEEDIADNDDGKSIFKGQHVLSGLNTITTIRGQFVTGILDNLEARFPQEDSNILEAYNILGLRPITRMSPRERAEWGNDKLETLISHYGKEQRHDYVEDGENLHTTAPAIIDPVATRAEWSDLKNLVVHEGYPTERLPELWQLINQHHQGSFSNMLILATLALTAPVHTADCERGFSCQNAIKTAVRNRLAPQSLDNLMTV